MIGTESHAEIRHRRLSLRRHQEWILMQLAFIIQVYAAKMYIYFLITKYYFNFFNNYFSAVDFMPV